MKVQGRLLTDGIPSPSSSGALLVLGSTALVVLTAVHAGVVAALFWSPDVAGECDCGDAGGMGWDLNESLIPFGIFTSSSSASRPARHRAGRDRAYRRRLQPSGGAEGCPLVCFGVCLACCVFPPFFSFFGLVRLILSGILLDSEFESRWISRSQSWVRWRLEPPYSRSPRFSG
ncbi:hypothetical protein DFP72DRAFT_421225 [Ephemerocybe angulata]|uniref:Uncharacterized protein n=1 Tax=Ephemerocybe angulata TaxID=980116 RepID=A0A8H6IEZ9_9AGAR|nr:hypothetical protein DFP72DRAFT_421225 [Tulosesus angulatus]